MDAQWLARLPDLATSVAALVMGAIVFRAAPRKPPNQFFALFLVLIAGNFLAGFVKYGFLTDPRDSPEAFGANRLAERIALQFQLMDPAVLLYFTLLYPRRSPWIDRPATPYLVMAPAVLLTAVSLLLPGAFIFSRYPGEPAFPFGLFAEPYLVAYYALAFVLLLRNYRTEPSDLVRGQVALFVVGFGTAILPRLALGIETATITPLHLFDGLVRPWNDLAVFSFRAGLTTVAFAATAVLLVHGNPRSREAWRTLKWLAAGIGLVVLTWLASALATSDPPTFASAFLTPLSFAIRWMVFATVVGYALLKYQVFDLRPRLQRVAELAAAGSVIVVLATAAVLAGPVLTGLSTRLGVEAVITLAVLVLVAPPLIRRSMVAARLWVASGTEQEFDRRRLEMYRAALEAGFRDGGLSTEAEAELRRLRQDLGISDEQHRALLGIARSDARSAGFARPALVGDILAGRYELGRHLGVGGHGRCRLARDTLLGREVVVKEVTAVQAEASAILDEARAAGRLNHPNIVTVYDAIDAGRTGYLVMEHCEGGNLRQLMRGPLPVAEAAAVLDELLAGLSAAHARGIVHGDVKPENILLTSGRQVKLADFGSAYVNAPSKTVISLPSQAGPATLAYMAPEQVHGEPATESTDLYAVALVAYELLAGRHPIELAGKNDLEVREAIAKETARRHRSLPPALWAWLKRGLAKQPEQRWRSAEEMRRSLEKSVGASGRSLKKQSASP